jgi:hypothetical protein
VRSPPGSGPSRGPAGVGNLIAATANWADGQCADTEGGQSFDPFRPLARVSIPLFKPSEQGSSIVFFGLQDGGSCSRTERCDSQGPGRVVRSNPRPLFVRRKIAPPACGHACTSDTVGRAAERDFGQTMPTYFGATVKYTSEISRCASSASRRSTDVTTETNPSAVHSIR